MVNNLDNDAYHPELRNRNQTFTINFQPVLDIINEREEELQEEHEKELLEEQKRGFRIGMSAGIGIGIIIGALLVGH